MDQIINCYHSFGMMPGMLVTFLKPFYCAFGYTEIVACVYQIPDTKRGNDKIDAVVVDEDSVGTTNAPGCGGKILCGNGALERYLEETKLKDQVVRAM